MSAHSGEPTLAEASRRSMAVVELPYTTAAPGLVSWLKVMPASIEQQYFPEGFGRSAGQVFGITR